MRPRGSAELLEDRRHRALGLLDEGRSLNEVARLLDCAPSSVMRWRDARDRKRLVRLLLQGALNHGYTTELWTTARISRLIWKEFRVRYHRDHVGRLLHGLGWTVQKPERRALERDEERIECWKKQTWPGIKKKPRGWAPTSSSSTSRASS